MTTNDIDAIRTLVNAADPGPWVTETNGQGGVWINLPAFRHAWGMHGFPDEAEFAAAARTLVPALCNEIEQLRAYAETTRYHQQQHAEAVREIEQLRAEREHMELNPTGTAEWLKNRAAELTGELEKVRGQLDAARGIADRFGDRLTAADTAAKKVTALLEYFDQTGYAPLAEDEVRGLAVDLSTVLARLGHLPPDEDEAPDPAGERARTQETHQ